MYACIAGDAVVAAEGEGDPFDEEGGGDTVEVFGAAGDDGVLAPRVTRLGGAGGQQKGGDGVGEIVLVFEFDDLHDGTGGWGCGALVVRALDELGRIEAETGLDFFSALSDDLEETLENQRINEDWLPEVAGGDVEPVYPPGLPPNHFNTVQAKNLAGSNKVATVCGTVVGARTSRAGNVLLNLDKQFPNQVFTVFIKKEHLQNFPYNPEQVLQGKVIYVKGKVIDLDGTPAMFIENDKALIIKE